MPHVLVRKHIQIVNDNEPATINIKVTTDVEGDAAQTATRASSPEGEPKHESKLDLVSFV